MALKDQLEAALAATPPDNNTRQETLRAVLAASGSGSDGEVQAALTRLIKDRETRVATFAAAGRSDAAKAERAEIDALRALLRLAVTDTPKPAPKKQNTAAAAAPVPAAKAMISGKQLAIGGAVLIAVAALGWYFLSPKAETGAGDMPIVVQADDRTMGDPKAPIVMLEYAAPTCPVCARFNEYVMPQVKAEYIDKGKVFFIFRTFPLSPTDGAVEGIARLCLPQDKYFPFLDLMYRNQPKWDPDGHEIPDVGGAVKKMASIMGVSPDQAERCMTDAQEQARINAVSKEAVARYQLTGTPTIIVNGQKLQDSERAWPQLKARFDSLLASKK